MDAESPRMLTCATCSRLIGVDVDRCEAACDDLVNDRRVTSCSEFVCRVAQKVMGFDTTPDRKAQDFFHFAALRPGCSCSLEVISYRTQPGIDLGQSDMNHHVALLVRGRFVNSWHKECPRWEAEPKILWNPRAFERRSTALPSAAWWFQGRS